MPVRKDELKCPRCGSEECFETTLKVDISKVPIIELVKVLLRYVPFYKCRKCGETFAELVDVVDAYLTYFAMRECL